MDTTSEDYDLDFDSGPRATFFLVQALYSTIAAAGGGAIVNLGSGSGTGGQPMFAAHGFADSPGVKSWQETAPRDYDRALRGVPLQRVGRMREDIGAVGAFLVGDDGTYLTGQTIMVDGGMGVFR